MNFPRKVHIETWGCQMNVADSERMLAMLTAAGYQVVDGVDGADLVLLNTCHIRDKARHKVVSRLGRLAEHKREKPGMVIAVAGCVAQAEGQKLLKASPSIDVLFGPGRMDELPALLARHAEEKKPVVAIGFNKNGNSRHHHEHVEGEQQQDSSPASPAGAAPAETSASPASAAITAQEGAPEVLPGGSQVSRFLNIQQGCNNYCTFCVVPFTRGREVSRPADEILREARAMVASGALELTLLGQNVNSYGHDLEPVPGASVSPFAHLLASVARIEGLARLRFTTSNPHDLTREVAALFAAEPKLGRYLHLPVQAGHDRTLERMKRKVTVAEYLEKVSWLRAAVPDIALSTDIIVGFPGESDDEFAATLDLVERVGFGFAYAFMYSPRKNTPAARYNEQVSEVVKAKRLAALNAVLDRLTVAANTSDIGRERDVLFLYESRKNPGYYYGRTEHYRLVRVPSMRPIVGQMLPVRILDANKIALLGDLI